MNPDPAANPTPETPTPLADLSPAYQKKLITDLERALAEAKRENAEQTEVERTLAQLLGKCAEMLGLDPYRFDPPDIIDEIERLKADKERLDWLEANPDKMLRCTTVVATIGRIFTFNLSQPCGECPRTLRAAIDHARTTQEGQG